jgi:N4-(beta-N-acetylglucosaminyl)-L-asparaginase
MNRRVFLASSGVLPALCTMARSAPPPPAPRRPAAIASANGLPSVRRAIERIVGGADPLEAAVEGVVLVEDDPEDDSVGYGGLPNEMGVVELDASVMHGPSHKAGAVAALRNVRNPSRVALEVMRRTDHVLLVGQGALDFARALGFPEQDLLTEKSRQAWLRWKASLNAGDDWLDEGQQVRTKRPGPAAPGSPGTVPHTTGTVHVAAVDASGDLGACTSTSGLSYKLPGRVGDSPIVGAGLFCDNQVGAAGSTGRGEAVLESAGSFQVVRHMADGLEPTEACLKVLTWIADHTRRPDLLDGRGRPNFDVTMYALRKDGAFGSATMRGSRKFAVHDGREARLEACAVLFA